MSLKDKVHLSQALAIWILILLSAVSCSREAPPALAIGSIEAMAKQSEIVIIGKVLKNRAKWVDKKILSTSEVKPIRYLKPRGEEPGDDIMVSFWGGTVGDINQHFTHGAILRVGEVAVLFLARPSRRAASYFEGMGIIHENGKIPLLKPGEDESRLVSNPRLKQFIEDLMGRIERGGSP